MVGISAWLWVDIHTQAVSGATFRGIECRVIQVSKVMLSHLLCWCWGQVHVCQTACQIDHCVPWAQGHMAKTVPVLWKSPTSHVDDDVKGIWWAFTCIAEPAVVVEECWEHEERCWLHADGSGSRRPQCNAVHGEGVWDWSWTWREQVRQFLLQRFPAGTFSFTTCPQMRS